MLREHRIQTMVFKDESEAIRRLAKKSRRSISNWVRDVLLSQVGNDEKQSHTGDIN